MNQTLAAGLGLTGGTLLGYLLTPKLPPHSVVYIAGNDEDADVIARLLDGAALDPIVDFSGDAIKGRSVSHVRLIAVPAENVAAAKALIQKYRTFLKDMPPAPALPPAPPPSDPREV